MRWTQSFSHNSFPLKAKGKGKKLIKALTIFKLTRNYSILFKKQLLGMSCLRGQLYFRNKNNSFSSFKSREKGKKVTLVTFNSFESVKGQVAR